jgi:hypothetical protein
MYLQPGGECGKFDAVPSDTPGWAASHARGGLETTASDHLREPEVSPGVAPQRRDPVG